MNLMTGGLFGGIGKAPRHDPKNPLEQSFSFGGYDALGNPIAQGPPPAPGMSGPQANGFGLGPGPYSFNQMPFQTPQGNFATQQSALNALRQMPVAQGMSDPVFNNFATLQGYDPEGKTRESFNRAYGEHHGGRLFRPLMRG